jgi:NADPH2:quinone reductase
MLAWTVHEFGPFRQVLHLEEQPPPAADGGALVRVHAADVNFPDLLVIAGKYQVKPELPFTPGFAAAGEVIEGAGDLAAGERVVCPLPYGAFREVVRVPPEDALPVPSFMSFAEAAAFFLSFQTGWLALFRQARLQPGETLLVHAGASGVGTAAIQLGKVRGAVVVATAGSAEKRDLCRRLGADHVLDHREDFAAAVRALSGGRGADVVFDPVGGELFERSTQCIAHEGRILPIGFASGTIPAIGANRILLKNISVVGMYWTTYWDRRRDLVRQAHVELLALYHEGRIAPVIHREYPLAELPRALAAIEGQECRGKAVLAM